MKDIYLKKIIIDMKFGHGILLLNHKYMLISIRVDPKSTKRHWQLDCLFALLGSMCVKAVCKHVGEIDPWSSTLLTYLLILGLDIVPLLST